MSTASDFRIATHQALGRVWTGPTETIDLLLTALLAPGHVLLEGVPGVAKTTLARGFAQLLGCDFRRIQFTPDLLPADITGAYILNMRDQQFVLRRGPIFAHVVLGDEINRAPAKTQSALLQAMQERTVTIDRDTHALPENFTVFATQNPIESECTYPLPEAQRDRFLLKIVMPCPDRDDELTLVRRTLGADAPENVLTSGEVKPVATAARLTALRAELRHITVQPELLGYAVDVVRATRANESVLVGAGPRASQALLLAARALAALQDRDFVTPDDLKFLAGPVLGHRLVLRPEFELEGTSVGEVVTRILETVAVPR